MEDTCAFCGVAVGVFGIVVPLDSPILIDGSWVDESVTVCPKCKAKVFEAMEAAKKLPAPEKGTIISKKEAEERAAREKASLLLSTCPSVEGFRVVKHLGLVFGECVYKTGFFKSLSAVFDDLGDYFTAGDKEFSGSARILASAREYAIDKMREDAVSRGANAIVGIDSETSLGGADIIHITIYGTAVKIEAVE